VHGHLPYEKQQELLWELGQIEIGVGTLVATNERIDSAVAQSIDSLKEWIRLDCAKTGESYAKELMQVLKVL
jgi:hypothetical protein